MPDNEKQLRMTEHFVAYLDVLGVKDRMNSTVEGERQLRFYIEQMEIARKVFTLFHPSIEISYRVFTDSIILAMPTNDTKSGYDEIIMFQMICFYAGLLQAFLSAVDAFVKGGIAKRPLYIDKNIVYGPALIEAYKLEQDEAHFPRIILSKGMADFWSENSKYLELENIVFEDLDGYHCVNYLAVLCHSARNEKQKKLKHHAIVIKRNLNKCKDIPQKLAKYKWLSTYHNVFCASLFPNENNLLISD